MKKESAERRRIIVWMRRALRIQDNLPLAAAIRDADEVVPLVILRDGAEYSTDSPRRRFIGSAMTDLAASLRGMDSGLWVRHGDPLHELPALAAELGAQAVYSARVYDPRLIERDKRIASALHATGVRWETFKDSVIFEGEEILTQTGRFYSVYTPYKNAWRSRIADIPPETPNIRTIKSPVPPSRGLPRKPWFRSVEEAGERAARRRLESFVKHGLPSYGNRRNYPGVEGTSRLSPDLANGTISVRSVVRAVMDARDGADKREREQIDTFINELIWREFYYQILANAPFVVDGAFREEFRVLPWRTDQRRYEAWCTGSTGYPIVDAGMRQLNAEGWMHNRVRMIVASFLTKDLHVDWRLGEEYFFGKLIDADVASNNGGWQWTAGTGTDASPYFRIFNPVLQAKKFDPSGTYVRTFVPELGRVPTRFVHEPWKLSDDAQRDAKCVIGRDYPRPIVDHNAERDVTLKMYIRRGKRG